LVIGDWFVIGCLNIFKRILGLTYKAVVASYLGFETCCGSCRGQYFIFGALCPSKSGLMNKHIGKQNHKVVLCLLNADTTIDRRVTKPA